MFNVDWAALLNKELLQSLLDTGLQWIAAYGVKIPVALGILLVGWWLSTRISRFFVRLLQKANVEATLTSFLKNIIYYICVAAVIIAALGQLGLNVTSLVAVLGAASLAICLALKDSLAHFAAGVIIILFRFYKVGDVIDVSGALGKVIGVNIFFTELASLDNKKIVIPNNKILTGVITNVTANPTRRIDLVIGVGYDDDIRKAKELLVDILENEPRVLENPAPLVGVGELGDSSVNFYVRPWVKTDDFFATMLDLTERIKLAFDDAGVSIPYPQQDVRLFVEKGE